GRERNQRGVKGECSLDHLLKIRGGNIIAEEGSRDFKTDFLKTQIAPGLPKSVTKHRQRIGHIQAIVWWKRAEDRLLQFDTVGGIVSRVVTHGRIEVDGFGLETYLVLVA